MIDRIARPVLHVNDVDASILFYVNLLGFTSPWRYNEEGRARVAEVDRQGCALILANNLDSEKIGKGGCSFPCTSSQRRPNPRSPCWMH
jgi:catechol 2,3-dioxygenase-like lactoylglutathione lyase family enzyme